MPTIPTVFRSIQSGDYRTTSFKAYKQYHVTGPSISGSGFTCFGAQHQKYSPALGASIASDDPINAADNPSGLGHITNQHVVWSHIDHRYYRHPYDPAKTSEHFNKRKTDKFLFLTGSIFSVPYFEMGEGIKPGSVVVTDNANDFTLIDDGNGNLKDYEVVSSSFAPKNKLTGYWTFNNEFRKTSIENKAATSTTNYGTLSGSLKYLSNTYTPTDVSRINDVNLKVGLFGTTLTGLAGHFNGTKDSHIVTPNSEEFNPGPADNFAWSFWLEAPISQSDASTNYNTLIRKQTHFVEEYYDLNDKLVKKRDQILDSTKYPYYVRILNHSAGGSLNGKIEFIVVGDENQISLRSTTHCTGSHHVLAQRSGSLLSLWIDGVKEVSSSVYSGQCKNNRDITFGVKQTNSNFSAYSGSMAELRYYKTGLTQTQATSLANFESASFSAFQTSTIGNVFYKNGHVVISSPHHEKYSGALSGTYGIKYKGIHTIYENEVLVQVPKDACNVSMNPSATYKPPQGNEKSEDYVNTNGPGEIIKPGFLSGSMKPYITTVGLYNDKSQLLAVGKLSQPVQKRDDSDMNFIVRWDY